MNKIELNFTNSNEQLPNHDKEVLIWMENGQFNLAYYNRKYNIWDSLRQVNKYWKIENTRWSELPE